MYVRRSRFLPWIGTLTWNSATAANAKKLKSAIKENIYKKFLDPKEILEFQQEASLRNFPKLFQKQGGVTWGLRGEQRV